MPEANVDVIVMTNRGDLTMDLTLLASDLVKASVGRKPGTGKKHNQGETPSPAPSVLPAP